MLQPVQSLNIKDDSTLSKEHDILIIIDKYILVLGRIYNLFQQERKTFLKIKLYQFCLHVFWIICTCAVPKDMLQKASNFVSP